MRAPSSSFELGATGRIANVSDELELAREARATLYQRKTSQGEKRHRG